MKDNMKTEIDQELSDQVDRIIRAILEQKQNVDVTRAGESYGCHLEDQSINLRFNAITEEFSLCSEVAHNSYVRTTAPTALQLLRDHFSKTHPSEPCIINDYDHELLNLSVIAGCIIQKSCRAYEIDSENMYVTIYAQEDDSYKAVVNYYDSDIKGIPFEDPQWNDMTGEGYFESVGSSVITALNGLSKARSEELKTLT